MKLLKDNDLIWEAFVTENVPGGIGGFVNLNDGPAPDGPSSELQASDASGEKAQKIAELRVDMKEIVERLGYAIEDNILDRESALELVHIFENEIKSALGDDIFEVEATPHLHGDLG